MFPLFLGLGSGSVLFGSLARGVLAWNGKTLTELLPALRNARVTALNGSEADLWIGTLADGVWHSHAGQLDHLLTDLPDSQVLSIAVNGASAYVGTPSGLRNSATAKNPGPWPKGTSHAHWMRMTSLSPLAWRTRESSPFLQVTLSAPAKRPAIRNSENQWNASSAWMRRGTRCQAGIGTGAEQGRAGWTRAIEPQKGDSLGP